MSVIRDSVIKLRRLFMLNKALWYSLVVGYIAIFIGCASFPLVLPISDYSILFVHVLNACYLVPLTLAALLGKGRLKVAYLISLVALILGMSCRYVIEIGEVSNTTNFTVTNVIIFLGILPTVYTFTYYLWSNKLD